MADRVAVIQDGRIAQVGAPQELYRQPATRFVAEFLGDTNILEAEVVESADGETRLRTAVGELRAATSAGCSVGPGLSTTVSIRPEALHAAAGPGPNVIHATVAESTYLGEAAQVCAAGGSPSVPLRALFLNPRSQPKRGEVLLLRVHPEDVVILPPGSR